MQPDVDRTAQSIALLNDQTRTITKLQTHHHTRHRFIALDSVDCILNLVKGFDDFSERNDPFGEHDFGAIEYEGNTVFWKIDYYDLDLMHHSPDPSDPHVTRRVLTIMLGEEY